MPKLAMLARIGLGGRIGGGTQGISWIHELDMNRLFHRAIEDTAMTGAYIASAPHPVSQVDFMRAVRKALGMPIGLPASAWMVKFGARVLMRTDPELVLYGRYVRSERLEQEGFRFNFESIDQAMTAIYR